jgi:hypothetical protein
MKTARKICMVVALGFALAAFSGCASGPKQSGFLGDYYGKLEPGPEGGIKYRWLKPGVDFAKYHRLMIDSVVFYYAPDSDDKSIDAEQMKELTDAFNTELVTVLKGRYPVVAEPGPDVARLRIALTNVKKSKPVVSAVTSVVPVGIGISVIKKGAGGAWSGSGATSAEFMALDSMTNDVIAAGEDEQTAGFTERFSRLGSAKEAFKFWAERLKMFMDQVHREKQ